LNPKRSHISRFNVPFSKIDAEEEKFFSVKKEKRKLAKNPVNRTLMPSASHTKPSIPTKVRGLINPENHNIIKLPTVDPGPGDY
jgi:hypothetical protein